MKSKILALTALLTLCTAAPATAQVDIDYGVTVGDRAGIVIIPARRRDRGYYRYYRRDGDRRPRYRIYRPDYYEYDRFYYPDRYGWQYNRRYRYERDYYPRRNSLQLRIGF